MDLSEVPHLGDRVVGYCSSCRYFRFHDEEADTLHPQLRFGRCRLGVVIVPARTWNPRLSNKAFW